MGAATELPVPTENTPHLCICKYFQVQGVTEAEIEDRTDELMAWVEATFAEAALRDLHQGYIHYQIKDSRITWATLFGTLEKAKKQFHIEDYSVSQTTLEQVFINFARSQRPPTEVGVSCMTKCTGCLRFCCTCKCC